MIVDRLHALLGKPAPELYTGLVALLPAVQEVAIAEYTPPPPIQQRASLSEQEKRLVVAAAEARVNLWFSYLEIVLEMSAKADHPVEGILNSIDYHQEHTSGRTWLSREDVLSGQLIQTCASASQAEPLAFFSKVKADSHGGKNVPLLDLRIEKSPQSLSMVASIARHLLGTPFAILETARSYHLVGFTLMTENEANRFLARAILFSPITDHAYIAHQLLEGESALRLSGRGEMGDVPMVIAVGCKESLTTACTATWVRRAAPPPRV